MRQYRYPTAALPDRDGPGYEYLQAEDAEAARAACAHLQISHASLQVKTAQGFQWVSEVPVHLGGITHSWFGEAV